MQALYSSAPQSGVNEDVRGSPVRSGRKIAVEEIPGGLDGTQGM